MTVLPHVGATTNANAETRRGPARKFDHHKAFADYCMGASINSLSKKYGVSRSSLTEAFERIQRDVARSPQQPPPVADPPPCAANGVGNDTSHVVEAGGLRGAPAGDPLPPARDEKEKDSLVEAGAPTVRLQLDEHGDTIYVLTLPRVDYATHSWFFVQEMLKPFDAATVRWINEED